MHYYKFNIPDWSLSTAHLGLEEEAIYFRLINHYYDTQLPIPIETQSVFRRLRLASQDKANAILNEFFVKTDKGWEHKRCEKVLKEYRKTAKKNKINGLKGGRPSKHAASSETQKKPSGLPDESQNNPNQELLTNNHKPLTSKKIKKALDYSRWPEQPEEQTLEDWLSMRKRQKANVTQTVINNYSKELQKAVEGGFTVDYCISECVTRNWRGFKFQWRLNQEQGNGSHKQINDTGNNSKSENSVRIAEDYLGRKSRGTVANPEEHEINPR